MAVSCESVPAAAMGMEARVSRAILKRRAQMPPAGRSGAAWPENKNPILAGAVAQPSDTPCKSSVAGPPPSSVWRA